MPAKAPPAIVSKVNADIARVVNTPEVKTRFAPQGIEVVTGSPQALAQLIKNDHARWGKIAKAAGIKGD
jgi:tripartite-type tricarboxylate transporter receptor subunit TctC